MRTVLKTMQKRKNNWIPKEKLDIFENVIDTYFVPGRGSNEGDNEFMKEIGEQFTQEQRFRIWEEHGGCTGSGHNKARKAFAIEYTGKPLAEKVKPYLEAFEEKYGKTLGVDLNEKNKTITYKFACDECYKHSLGGKMKAPFELYYERCALGRMENLQTALGIKLIIKSVDIPSGGVSKESPCVFTFDIVE